MESGTIGMSGATIAPIRGHPLGTPLTTRSLSSKRQGQRFSTLVATAIRSTFNIRDT